MCLIIGGRRPRMIRENVPDQMPAMPGPQIEIRWLADTGCPFDLVGMHDIPAQDHRHIKNGRIQHSLQTANGVAGTQGRVDATVESLDEDIEAFVMDNTPLIVSIGRRCVDFGYSFRQLRCMTAIPAMPGPVIAMNDSLYPAALRPTRLTRGVKLLKSNTLRATGLKPSYVLKLKRFNT